MIAKAKSCKGSEGRLTPSAAYIRMSSGKQERSPEQQRDDLRKLAQRDGCEVVEWFDDEAVTGDSGCEKRPGLEAMLRGAEQGRFKAVLVWHTNRLSRQDEYDSIEVFNRLRKAGVTLVSHSEGTIDLGDFAKRLLLFVGQKANNDFLKELSQKSLRGKLANARRGRSNGGSTRFGLDRALFGPDDKMVRRLAPGESVRMPGHYVALVPSANKEAVAAVRYAFDRFDRACISLRALAKELAAKGFPSPSGKGWCYQAVGRILTAKEYIGARPWGRTSIGRYYRTSGGEIIEGDGKTRKGCEPIVAETTGKGIIDPALFERVQRKLSRKEKQRAGRRREFSLSGLLICDHCGKTMLGDTVKGRDRKGKPTYEYLKYTCSTYATFGRDCPRNQTCGHHQVDADLVSRWLVAALQREFLGPSRSALVAEMKRKLKAEAKGGSGDTKRLEKRVKELDQEVARLVKAVRTCDMPELMTELAEAKRERESVAAQLAAASRFTTPKDIDAEAETIVDGLREMVENLDKVDPATLRELFRQLISRIVCRWERREDSPRNSYRLVEGIVELRHFGGNDCLWGNDASVTTSTRGSRTGGGAPTARSIANTSRAAWQRP